MDFNEMSLAIWALIITEKGDDPEKLADTKELRDGICDLLVRLRDERK